MSAPENMGIYIQFRQAMAPDQQPAQS